MNPILVSVIIPVYNVESYLKQCLNSVINQTLKDIEIICVDDGSTDNSLKILKEFSEEDKRIVIIEQKNLYAGVARNTGLKIAKGKYLSFLDADDFFEPKMLEDMYNQAEKDKSDIVCCGWKNYNNRLKRFVGKREIQNQFIIKSPMKPVDINPFLFVFSQVNPWTKLIKRKIFIDNNIQFEDTVCSNDLTAICLALSCAKQISVMKTLYVNYRMQQIHNVTSLRKKDNIGFLCDLQAVNNLKKHLDRLNLFELVKPSYMYRCKRFMYKHNNEEDKKIMKEKLSEDVYSLFFQ